MRKTILTAVAVLVIGGAAAATLIANAQPAPQAGPGPDAGAPPRWMAWMHRMRESQGWAGRLPIAPMTFALVYPQADRQLTPPDVQKIAEAFLLWNGNHTWKVIDVAPTSDGAIGFALATQDGSAIAHFTMDPHSGRVTRAS